MPLVVGATAAVRPAVCLSGKTSKELIYYKLYYKNYILIIIFDLKNIFTNDNEFL